MKLYLGLMKDSHYLLLGDIIDSRKIDDRQKFQKDLIDLFDRINNRFCEHLYADLKILKGIDEFATVLKDPSKTYEIIKMLQESILPQRVRIVLAKGSIDVAQEKRDVEYMDGPVFHIADKLMNDLKKTKLFFDLNVGDQIIESALFGQINTLILLKNDWTSKQLVVIKNFQKYGSQKKVAKDLNITPQAVSQNLDRSNYKEIHQIEKRLNKFMELYKNEQRW